MSIFRRGAFPGTELDSFPMWQLLDGYANHVINSNGRQGGSFGPSALSSSGFKSFSPKFDVKENQDSFELYGELPGIEQKDVDIEFTDAQTLVVKGQSQRVREEGKRPSALIESEDQFNKVTDDSASESSYHKPTVEDENATPASEAPKEEQSGQVAVQEQQEKGEQPPQSRYWIREMSSGSFSRTFAFPTRVDQDSVKASLKNGVLSIVVPKAQAPQSKRINIE